MMFYENMMKFISEKVRILACAVFMFAGICAATENNSPAPDDCMTFVLATDSEYIDKTAITILSIILNCSTPLHFIVFVGENVKQKSLEQVHSESESERTEAQASDAHSHLSKPSPELEKTKAPTEVEVEKIKSLKNLWSSLNNTEVFIDIINLMDENNIPLKKLRKQLEDHVQNRGENLFMWLRLYVPNLIKSNISPLSVPLENYYFWIDSDILVTGDLRPLYDDCQNKSRDFGQGIISANYYYLNDNFNKIRNTDGYGYDGICSLKQSFEPASQKIPPVKFVSSVEWREAQSKLQPNQKHPCVRVSGGLVFFNTSLLVSNKKHPFPMNALRFVVGSSLCSSKTSPKQLPQIPKPQQTSAKPASQPVELKTPSSTQNSVCKEDREEIPCFFQQYFAQGNDNTEEVIFGNYLSSTIKERLFFFPIKYNCRCCYPTVAQAIVSSNQNRKIDASLNDLLDYNNVVVWHPDREKKFWEEGCAAPQAIIEMWLTLRDIFAILSESPLCRRSHF